MTPDKHAKWLLENYSIPLPNEQSKLLRECGQADLDESYRYLAEILRGIPQEGTTACPAPWDTKVA